MPEMAEDLDIVVTGFEVEQGRAEAGLIRVFGLDSDRARKFYQQLPIVAKRCSGREAAERYAHALRTIGARVELRLHVEAHAGGERTSLPAPAGQSGPRESLRAASARAAARFRSDDGSDDPRFTPSGLDLYNPQIPKAPALPHDLRQMPNGPRSGAPERSQIQRAKARSDPPEWVISDPLALTPHPDGKAPEGLRASDEDSIRVVKPSKSSSNPARSSDRMSDRPRSVGLAHSATATGRPGLSASRFSLGSSLTPTRKRFARWIAIAMGLISAALIYGRITGTLRSEDERRIRAWEAQGIEPGEHSPARGWLAEAGQNRQVRGFHREELEALFSKLDRAGSPPVYAIGISQLEGGTEEASGLLVEMPGDKAQRRTLLWHLAAARGEADAPLLDDGKPFQVLRRP